MSQSCFLLGAEAPGSHWQPRVALRWRSLSPLLGLDLEGGDNRCVPRWGYGSYCQDSSYTILPPTHMYTRGFHWAGPVSLGTWDFSFFCKAMRQSVLLAQLLSDSNPLWTLDALWYGVVSVLWFTSRPWMPFSPQPAPTVRPSGKGLTMPHRAPTAATAFCSTSKQWASMQHAELALDTFMPAELVIGIV